MSEASDGEGDESVSEELKKKIQESINSYSLEKASNDDANAKDDKSIAQSKPENDEISSFSDSSSA